MRSAETAAPNPCSMLPKSVYHISPTEKQFWLAVSAIFWQPFFLLVDHWHWQHLFNVSSPLLCGMNFCVAKLRFFNLPELAISNPAKLNWKLVLVLKKKKHIVLKDERPRSRTHFLQPKKRQWRALFSSLFDSSFARQLFCPFLNLLYLSFFLIRAIYCLFLLKRGKASTLGLTDLLTGSGDRIRIFVNSQAAVMCLCRHCCTVIWLRFFWAPTDWLTKLKTLLLLL